MQYITIVEFVQKMLINANFHNWNRMMEIRAASVQSCFCIFVDKYYFNKKAIRTFITPVFFYSKLLDQTMNKNQSINQSHYKFIPLLVLPMAVPLSNS